MTRGGLFRKSKRCCGRPSEYVVTLSFSLSLAFHLPRGRHTTFDRSEQREGDTSGDDRFDEAVIDKSRYAKSSRGACSVDSSLARLEIGTRPD